MKIDGSCHCGAIRYEAQIDADGATICHCTDCQALSGSPFRVLVTTAEDQFLLTAGQPRIYVKTAASGAKRLQAFCSECGSPIYATAADKPADGSPRRLGLRLGTIRQRSQIRPSSQIWRKSALDWVPPLPELRCFAEED